jgi:peptide/nickel transport system substrate-binding protein
VSIGRRRVLSFAAACAGLSLAPRGWASGRLPSGGKLSLRLPWPLSSIDPHRIDDASAAILGSSLFDSLYAYDEAGAAIPSLAEALPETSGSRLTVTLRRGLRSALGRPIQAKDVRASLARASSLGAKAWLVEVLPPKVDSSMTLSFPRGISPGALGALRDSAKLAHLLASPLTAIVPSAFSPEEPDGTGPFRATRREGALVLERNDHAASGPALLEEVTVREAGDLGSSLSAFESGVDDLGWLGSGLHEPRPGARSFDAGACAWAILRTGSAAGAWDAPGVAQSLCDGISPGRLSYLAMGPAWPAGTDEGWGGPPSDLLVRDDAPWLLELAKAVASSISRPSHDVTVHPVPQGELAARRAARSFALALDVARPTGPGALGALVGLGTADDPLRGAELMRHPPRAEASPRVLCRTMRIGVVGDVRIQGGRAADLSLGSSGFDLGAFTRTRVR